MTKIEKDLEKVTHPSIIQIGKHLINMGNQNENIKSLLDKDNKSIEEMYKHVTAEARKLAENSSIFVDDETVYDWALNYYEDDLIVIAKTKKEENASESIKTEIELPEEEDDVFEI